MTRVSLHLRSGGWDWGLPEKRKGGLFLGILWREIFGGRA
jgi:hypothetical protein